MIGDEDTLDCQSCGYPIRTLTQAEAQEVANRPYNYIVFCGPCRRLIQGEQ